MITFTSDLIGFVDLGDIELNYSTLNDVSELASYLLVFMIKSFANPLSYSLATLQLQVLRPDSFTRCFGGQ